MRWQGERFHSWCAQDHVGISQWQWARTGQPRTFVGREDGVGRTCAGQNFAFFEDDLVFECFDAYAGAAQCARDVRIARARGGRVVLVEEHGARAGFVRKLSEDGRWVAAAQNQARAARAQRFVERLQAVEHEAHACRRHAAAAQQRVVEHEDRQHIAV